ncbi:hypothetical protein [Marinicauda salina]|uniref:hypothetical protein n=1 Tax=Marinicauda salina TaxID=2135793 RepID=UPI0013049B85|nr:hypothetical protein [Marinicauda salina]
MTETPSPPESPRPVLVAAAARVPVLAWLALAWLALAALSWTTAGVGPGELKGPDDYLRGMRVLRGLAGDGPPTWFEPRMGPPGGVELHWSALPGWPIAGLTWCISLFTDRETALMLASRILPAAYLAGFLAAAVWAARPFLGRRHAPVAGAALLVAFGHLLQFSPGRIDHHGLQALILMIAVGGLARGCVDPLKTRAAAIAGAAFGLGLAIGAEITPWFALAAVFAGLIWLARGRRMERINLAFGASAFATTGLAFLVMVPPSRWGLAYCDALSPTYVAIAAALAAMWAGVAIAPRAAKATVLRRTLLGAGLALPLTALLYLAFPACFADPYALDDPLLAEIWLKHVSEARSAPAAFGDSPGVVIVFVAPVLAGLAAAVAAAIAEPRRRALWAGWAVVMAGALAMGLLQLRVVHFTHALAVFPLAWLLIRAWSAARCGAAAFARLPGRTRLFVEAIAFVVLLPVAVLSVRTASGPDGSGAEPAACDVRAAAAALAAEPPTTVAAAYSHGSELLFRTDHRVLAASYHRNEAGLLAGHRLFTATDPGGAEAIARDNGVGLVMVCAGDLARLRRVEPDGEPFAAQLWAGAPPAWLEPVSGSRDEGYRVYRVRPAAG